MKATLINQPIKKWRLDINHTGLHFRVGHLGLEEVRGSFTEYQGIVVTYDDEFDSAKVDLVIKLESISTANLFRDNHLKSADFFDVANYPELKFESTEFENLGNHKYRLEGSLTIKGITKNISFDTTFRGD